jgi:hypothetical protein
MKIVFVCGSLQPGHDGVGDYTRRLAAEMLVQGHEVAIIALNDAKLNTKLEGIQRSENIDLPVLRLPAAWPTKLRFSIAKEWVHKFNPEWISLQFAIFSFHSKGFPVGLIGFLAGLGKGRRWHIMFHELWVGMSVGASIKHIFWGWLQQKIISRLIFRLKPKVIHTQSMLYFAQLTRLGFKVNHLPLFSNVPVVANFENKGVKKANEIKHISIVVFGTIHPQAPVEQIVNEVILYKKAKEPEVSLTIIGRSGIEQEHWVSVWKSAGICVDILGEQPLARISKVLNKATIGLSTGALAMIDKSGTVAAMLAHKLPVICVAKPWKPRKITLPTPPKGIFVLQKGCIENCLEMKRDEIPSHGISDITHTLIKTLLAQQ